MISLFCTGASVDDISEEDMTYIRRISTVYGINYFNRIEPDYRFFMDVWVAEWIKKQLDDTGKIAVPITSHDRFVHPELKNCGIIANFTHPYTFLNALDYLWQNFPNEIVLLFGADFTDTTIKNEVGREDRMANNIPVQKFQFDHIPMAMLIMKNKEPHRFDKYFNCNLNSKLEYIRKESLETLKGVLND